MGEPVEGRVALELPGGDFDAVKCGVVLLSGSGDGVVVRLVRLDDRPSRLVAAAGPARHLAEQGKRTLAGAKIRQVQAQVRQQDGGQSDIRQIQPARYHLRSHQDLRLPVGEAFHRRFQFRRIANRIRVPTVRR